MPKPKCFVIQPFDDDNNQRFEDTIRPAIERAGLEAYRVDQDPAVQVLIESIEEKIRESTVCLADITKDNPNVWYEVGYARAMKRRLVLICSNDRQSFPFDIRHRQVERYGASPTAYEKLGNAITERCRALLEESDGDAFGNEFVDLPKEVSDTEEIILRTLAESAAPGQAMALYSLQTAPAMAQHAKADLHLGLWKLEKRTYLTRGEEENPDGYPEDLVKITDTGWRWLSKRDPFEKSGDRTPVFENEATIEEQARAGDLGDDDDDRVPF